MKRNEWRDHQGLTEEEMQRLEDILKRFNGKIINIIDNPEKKIL